MAIACQEPLHYGGLLSKIQIATAPAAEARADSYYSRRSGLRIDKSEVLSLRELLCSLKKSYGAAGLPASIVVGD